MATATFLLWAAVSVYVPTLPVYARSLGASLADVGLIVSAFGVSQLILRLPIGLTSDRLGRRLPYLAAGLLLTGIGGAVLLVAPNAFWLMVGRGLAGAGAASWVAITVLFTRYFRPNQTPRALALVNSVNGLAQVCAAYAGGFLAGHFGWHAPFLAAVALGLGGLVPLVRLIEPSPMVERPTALPALRLFASRPLGFACVAGTITTAAMHGTAYTFTPVLIADLGGSPADVGAATALMLLAYTVGTFGGATAVSRFGLLSMLYASLLLTGLALPGLAVVSDLGGVVVLQTLHGLGRGLLVPLLMTVTLRAAPPGARATTMGIFQMFYALGLFLGPASLGGVAGLASLPAVFITAGVASLLCLPFVPLAREPGPGERGQG